MSLHKELSFETGISGHLAETRQIDVRVGSVEALMDLQDGWLEGGGKAPDADSLIWLKNEMVRAFPADLEHSAVVPNEEGNVVFEWIRPDARIELEVNFTEKRLELYATNVKTNHFVKATYPLDGWKDAFANVSTLLGENRGGTNSYAS
jgi:hypothetical protein